jgi:hypothetical protein
MPTLSIGNQKIKVGDDFLKLSPDEQSEAVDEIANSLGVGPQPTDTAPAESVAPPLAPQGRGIMETVDDYVRAAANGMTLGLADRFAAKMGSATGIGGTAGAMPAIFKASRSGPRGSIMSIPFRASGLISRAAWWCQWARLVPQREGLLS